MKKIKHILKAIASGLIWGLGQLFNKQYIKALFFFLIFVGFISIEVGSSKYFSGYDPYTEKIEGVDFSENLANATYRYYLANHSGEVEAFEEFYAKHKQDSFTNDELIEFLAMDILNGSQIKYTNLSQLVKNDYSDRDYDGDLSLENDIDKINKLIAFNGIKTTYFDKDNNKHYEMETRKDGKDTYNVYVNISDSSDVVSTKGEDKFALLERNNVIYYDKATKSKFYIEVKNGNEIVFYENVQNPLEHIVKSDFVLEDYEKLNMSTTPGSLMYNDEAVYVYYNPEIHRYKATKFTEIFSESLKSTIYTPGSRHDQTDLARFKLKVYFKMHPEMQEDFETRFDNFFYDRAGFFLKGFWGLFTLGTSDKEEYYQVGFISNCIHYGEGMEIERINVEGHLSSEILIQSLISIFLFCYFMIVYVWAIKDAYNTSINYEKTHVKEKDLVYFKKMYEKSFEYIVLFPAIFTITFISIMPIFFSFLVAFTSYSGQTADVGLFKWVGFKNFKQIFSFGGDIPFGQTFWKVFVWTAIWAVFSTATVFFGGFFQALVINSERVPLKKFWRTLLILPWAIPAIITQMVFANIFNEHGVVNAFLENVGLYDVFKNWGILGVKFEEITSGWQRAFYLGYDNIQWFTNPYNKWFVRIVLIVVNIWIGFPYFMALMTGVMTGIDKSLYEAADIDGAGKFQKFRYVTFPLVMFSTAPLLVMSFSGNFNNFGMIYFVTQGGNGAGDIATAYAGDTDILISWIYALTVDKKTYNMASVFSILIFLIVGSIAAWNYSRTKAFKED